MSYYSSFFFGALIGLFILSFFIELFLKKIYFKKRYKISLILALIIATIVFKNNTDYFGTDLTEHLYIYILAAIVLYFIKIYFGRRKEEKNERIKPSIEKKLKELNKLRDKGQVDEDEYKDLKKKILEKELIK